MAKGHKEEIFKQGLKWLRIPKGLLPEDLSWCRKEMPHLSHAGSWTIWKTSFCFAHSVWLRKFIQKSSDTRFRIEYFVLNSFIFGFQMTWKLLMISVFSFSFIVLSFFAYFYFWDLTTVHKSVLQYFYWWYFTTICFRRCSTWKKKEHWAFACKWFALTDDLSKEKGA